MNRAAILASALALALAATAACTEEAAAPTEERAAAVGEVLGGAISDAMIPLEQLESQAPLAPRAAPAATDIDAQQPEVSGELASTEEGAEAAPAAPTPAEAPVTE